MVRTLSAARVGQSSEDLSGLARAELEHEGRLRLEQRNRTAQQHVLLLVIQLRKLKRDVLSPRVTGLDLTRHLRELESDDRVLDKLLAESGALEGVLHRLLHAHASKADRLHGDAWGMAGTHT